MANFDGVNYAKVNAVPSQKISKGEVSGDVRYAYEEYTSLANLAAADVIRTGIKIPMGCRIKSIRVVSPTNGGTVSVGIAGNATKYINAGSAGAATVANPLSQPTADEDLIITMGVATATGKYTLECEYVLI